MSIVTSVREKVDQTILDTCNRVEDLIYDIEHRYVDCGETATRLKVIHYDSGYYHGADTGDYAIARQIDAANDKAFDMRVGIVRLIEMLEDFSLDEETLAYMKEFVIGARATVDKTRKWTKY